MSNYNDLNKWASDALRNVVTNPKSIEVLDNEKEKYDGMTRKQKREADWKSQELTGETNEERYNRLKSSLSKTDIKDDSNIELDYSAAQTVSEAVEDKYDFSGYTVTLDQIDNVINWAHSAMRVIIYPTNNIDTLDDLFIKFKSQIRKHQRESDWKSIEVFGIDNETHYKYLKSKYSKENIIPKVEEEPRIKIVSSDNNDTIISSMTEIQCKFIRKLDIEHDQKLIMEGCLDLIDKKKTFYEDRVVSRLIDDTIELFNKNVTQITDDIFIPYIDMPFYDPEEMMILGIHDKEKNLFNVEASDTMLDDHYTIKQWFEAYTLNYNGFYTKNMYYMNECRVEKLKNLYNELESTYDTNRKKAIKQTILELGWNPTILFNEKNRSLAYERAKDKIRNKHGNTSIIDTSFYNEAADKIIFQDIKWKKCLNPVYIVLIEGKRLFSDITKKFTNSRFSHAAIGFDSSLTRLYSFNLDNGRVGKNGGFSVESIEKYPHGNNLEVFTIFVKDPEYDQIMKFVDNYIDDQTKTSYSLFNILTLAFNVPFNNNMSMVCSQFVDRLLKMVNIDITKKNSALVVPGDFEKASYANKKIYKVYDDKVEKYNSKQVNRKIEQMASNVEPIKEMFSLTESTNTINPGNISRYIAGSFSRIDNMQQLALYSEYIKNPLDKKFFNKVVSHYITAKPVCEIKEFPVQFSKDGDLLIKNYKKLDLNKEYNNSNKLLKTYAASNNIEGMKYEISKLQFLKDILDSKIYSNGEKNTNVDKKLVTLRALVMNDFKRYLNEIMKSDESFNFTEYYNNSPFGDAIVKINSSTLKYTVDILKQLLK